MNNFKLHKNITSLITMAWVFLVFVTVIWNLWSEYHHHIILKPQDAARSSFKRNTSLRLWFASHGGVYVPPTPDSPPNPYLSHVPDRDILTTSGKKLTLMNPAYAIRHFSEFASENQETSWHITSLNLLSPSNAPDEWEKKALKEFENGKDEVLQYAEYKGKPYLRLMKPLKYDEKCQKCHGHMGYDIGDVRGGVGAYFSMEKSIADFNHSSVRIIVTYLLILITGLGLIRYIYLKQKKSYEENYRLEIKQQKTLEELKRREAQLTESQNVAKLGNWDIDLLSHKVECSKQIFELFDIEQAGFEPDISFLKEVVHQDDLQTIETNFIKAVEDQGNEFHVEVRIINKTGRQWVMEAFAKVLFDESGKALNIYGTAQDVSIRRKTEDDLQMIRDNLENEVEKRTIELQHINAQLLHAEKLSAIGGLSASIAHEFNNPLAGITNVIGGIKRRATYDEEDENLLNMALDECKRMKNLIKSLQDFNRPTSGKFSYINIHESIDSILLLLKKEIALRKIKLTLHYADDLPMIKAVGDQIKQVFLNLLNNACDACENGDEITIITARQDSTVSVEIRDTGKGIKSEHISHIFEPFFTTKPEIKGTGLGLSVSYGIIKKHSGMIVVESVENEGSSFTVTLPIEGNYNG